MFFINHALKFKHQHRHLKVENRIGNTATFYSRVELKCVGTWWRMGGEVKGKLVNGVGSQYSSHYLGTWCIQHYYCWCAHLSCQ